MLFVETTTWDIPNFDYFKDELGWHIENNDDLLENLQDLDDEELRLCGGECINYDYKIIEKSLDK